MQPKMPQTRVSLHLLYCLYSVSQKSSPPKTFCGIFFPGEPV